MAPHSCRRSRTAAGRRRFGVSATRHFATRRGRSSTNRWPWSPTSPPRCQSDSRRELGSQDSNLIEMLSRYREVGDPLLQRPPVAARWAVAEPTQRFSPRPRSGNRPSQLSIGVPGTRSSPAIAEVVNRNPPAPGPLAHRCCFRDTDDPGIRRLSKPDPARRAKTRPGDRVAACLSTNGGVHGIEHMFACDRSTTSVVRRARNPNPRETASGALTSRIDDSPGLIHLSFTAVGRDRCRATCRGSGEAGTTASESVLRVVTDLRPAGLGAGLEGRAAWG